MSPADVANRMSLPPGAKSTMVTKLSRELGSKVDAEGLLNTVQRLYAASKGMVPPHLARTILDQLYEYGPAALGALLDLCVSLAGFPFQGTYAYLQGLWEALRWAKRGSWVRKNWAHFKQLFQAASQRLSKLFGPHGEPLLLPAT